MAAQALPVAEFLEKTLLHPVLDVRSPGEYQHACIPGAVSFPLFSDEERKIVGTLYKQKSREDAIRAGLDFFGPKMRRMVEEAEALLNNNSNTSADNKTLLIHCWRGGMRSGAVAWLLSLYGFRVFTLSGGYKSFRRWALQCLENPGSINILGGYTGSGKTEALQALQEGDRYPVIDLEGLAGHKGSAFGAIGMPRQPSQEMFENKLAYAIFSVRQRFGNQPIWMEDESQRIGTVNLTQPFWIHFRKQPVFFLDIPFDERLQYLVATYGKLNRGDLAAAITRIQKRLGGLETKTALLQLVEGDLSGAFRILLQYYDKKYGKSLLEREHPEIQIQSIKASTVNASASRNLLIQRLTQVPS